jgi:hypothetical protein
MKNLLCVLTLFLASCVGNKARELTLNPVAQQVWPNVRVDFDRGLADGIAKGELNETGAVALRGFADELTNDLESGDRIALAGIPWSTQMQPWAVRGVSAALAAGEIGPNGANILMQRIANFSAVMMVLQGQVTLPVAQRERVNPYIKSPAERRLLAALECGR